MRVKTPEGFSASFPRIDHDTVEPYMNPLCGHWQREYMALHERLVHEHQKSGKSRFLVFSSCGRGFPCGGTGDHLVGMASTFLLALLSRRAFFIEWPELYDTEALEPASFDWRLDGRVHLRMNGTIIKNCSGLTQKHMNDVELEMRNFNMDQGKFLFQCLPDRLSCVEIIRIHINRGITHWALKQTTPWARKLRDMGFRMPYISGCILNFLVRQVLTAVPSPVSLYLSLSHLELFLLSRCITLYLFHSAWFILSCWVEP